MAHPVGMTSPELDRLAERFARFGREAVATDSPLYSRLSEGIAEHPDVLAPMEGTREGTPMVFLAAVHDELLRDPRHPLAEHYPDVTPEALPEGDPWPVFAAFCAEHSDALRATLEVRGTQTNEVARCAGLLPCFATVADGRPLALIEVGASAGLNLCWDRYAYDYAGTPAGAPASPLRIECALRDGREPPLEGAPVASRVGVDLNPVDLGAAADVRWLHACVWPDQPARHARLDAAIAIAREDLPELRRGDALELLPGLIADAPAEALVCVFHTAALAYFSRPQVARLEAILNAAGRDVAWVGGESPGVVMGAPRAVGEGLHFQLTAGPPGALRVLGRMGHHGGWLEWPAQG